MLSLRQMPDSYMFSKRQTSLGTSITLEIAKSVIGAKDFKQDKFSFEILLRDKYPFQPPMIFTKTSFGPKPFSDGRDLLLHVLPEGFKEWQPSIQIK